MANFVIGNNVDRDGAEATLPGGDEDAVSTGATGTAGFFASFRSDRDTTREQEIEYLDAIIEQGADQETLADAQQQKLDIVDSMEKELTVESLLKAKGFARRGGDAAPRRGERHPVGRIAYGGTGGAGAGHRHAGDGRTGGKREGDDCAVKTNCACRRAAAVVIALHQAGLLV